MPPRHNRLLSIYLGISTLLSLGFIVSIIFPDWSAQDKIPLIKSRSAQGYAKAVNRAAPAVVNVYTSKLTRQKPTLVPTIPGVQLSPAYKRENSLGSGVVIDKNGYVLTNHHVVENASDIFIVGQDHVSVRARIVGSDPDTDLALLQMGGKQLPTLKTGDSSNLQIGDIVLAIGNPFGFGQTVTQGIVSAKQRDDLGITALENFIQTDAAINPGSSGGALINAKGELIGINTAIPSPESHSQGIGFAIPINLALDVKNQLIEHGRVIRGWLGVSIEDLGDSTLPGAKTPHRGVRITHLDPRGPAYRAGLRIGDIVLQLDETEITRAAQLKNWVSRRNPNTTINILFERKNETLNSRLIIGERPAT